MHTYIYMYSCIHIFIHNNIFMLIHAYSYVHTYIYDSEKCFVPLTVGGGIRCVYTYTPA